MTASPFKINLFLLSKLPAAFMCGIRVMEFDSNRARALVNTRWINKNPFGSLYFAVQAMAAELSTGILVMYAIRRSGHRVSMLVTHLEGEYHKKATGRIVFACKDGLAIADAVLRAVAGESVQIIATSTGRNALNEAVSTHRITWSLKLKQPLKS